MDFESVLDSVIGLPLGILGFEMRNVGCKEKCEGVTLSGNDRCTFSPLPHLSLKAECLNTNREARFY